MSVEDDFIDGEPAKRAQIVEARKAQEDIAEQALRRRQLAYRRVFSSGDTQQDDLDIVMLDLSTFGRMFESTILPIGVAATWPSEVLEGRRQVALRIMEHAGLPLDALFRRYHRQG